MADVVIKTIPLSGGIYMLQGRGGNIGVSAGPDGVALIDDQFAPLVPKILEAVRALGKGDPKFVINTHWHGDHTGGNPELGAKATILAQENVRKRLAAPQDRGDGQMTEPTPPAGLPVVTFQQSVSLHMNGEEIRVMHFPHGHTDTDSVVFFTGSNVVHMGDHLFNGRFPFVDTSSGGDPVQYAANVKAILDQIKDDTKVIPGHGPLATKADLAAFHAMLVDTIKVVRAAKKAGKSLAEAQKAGLPEKYKTWGEGFIKPEVWIETIYKSIK
jgi:glyoxylase-like metal-dependent hydrolase (beta-lactamase superfamily II)